MKERKTRAVARLRAHIDPMGVAIAVLMLLMGSSQRPKSIPALDGAVATGVYAALMAVGVVMVMVRRRHPLAFVLVTGAAMVAHVAVFTQISPLAAIVTLVAAETTQSRLAAPWRWLLLGAIYAGTGVEVLLAAYGLRLQELLTPEFHDPIRWFMVLASAWTVITLAAFIGESRRRRRERYEQAIERAAVLEAQQDAERRLAVSAERNRIARGVHDAVGHSLSAIAMQAEGARAVMGADPDTASEALAVIGRTARASIEEVRGLLEVLRDDEAPAAQAPSAPPSAPAVSAEPPAATMPAPKAPLQAAPQESHGPSLLGVVQEARLAGLPVSLTMTTRCEPPAAAEDALARIVREALANILRHAPGATTRIEARIGGSECVAEISNDAGGADTGPGTGLGLSGMRQRAEALGGSLSAGPTPEGGWRVAVSLPLG